MNINNKYYSNEGQVINITIRVFRHEQEVRLDQYVDDYQRQVMIKTTQVVNLAKLYITTNWATEITERWHQYKHLFNKPSCPIAMNNALWQ